MSVLTQYNNGCWTSGCHKGVTHVLHSTHTSSVGSIDNEVGYCLDHALYFFAWLQYCYPDEYSNVYITPPASELFGR